MTQTQTSRSIVLFRRDLRLLDNLALHAASLQGEVLPVYIFEDNDDPTRSPGAASLWWLHHSLAQLQKRLAEQQQQLYLFNTQAKQSTSEILLELCKQNQCSHVFWNRRYEPDHIQQDTELKKTLKEQGIIVHSFNNNLLSEPWQQFNKQGTPFKVFTPYWRHCKNQFTLEKSIPEALPIPTFHQTMPEWQVPNAIDLDSLSLLPTNPNWAENFHQHWQPGETSAQKSWEQFLESPINHYEEARNIPSKIGTSRLSPHLAFGEISVRQIWHDVIQQQMLSKQSSDDLDRYLSEIGWREFSYYQLYHFPELPEKNFNARFDAFQWKENQEQLQTWQQGLTGYPLVDAGMRELWQTGYMHNRVRMVVASFLCKDLLIHWQAGAQWFLDTLLDADLASNSASWQWCAGCGADAAPFFRIFNPTTQSEKFDAEGTYIRHWIPEISQLPNKWIHRPSEAPANILKTANIELNKTYPQPMIDHKLARLEALDRYKDLKTLNS